jgi:hypothetical protein
MSEGKSENDEGVEEVTGRRKCTCCGSEEFEVVTRGVGQFGGRNKVGEKVTICKRCKAVAG